PVAFIGYKFDYKNWRRLAPPLIIVTMFMLALVLIPGVGVYHGGARRWLPWPIQFAPAEVYKLTLILYLAAWFEKRQGEVKSFVYATIPFLAVLGITAVLIMFQPDTGSFVTVAGTATLMYIVAGASWSHISVLFGLGVAGIAFLI